MPVFDPAVFDAAVFEADSGVTLTATRFTNASTFGAATITPGAATLTAARYVDPDSFGAATISVSGGPQTLTPTLFADPDTFGAATITTGAVTISPTRFVNANAFGSHTITNGEVLALRRGGDDSPRERFWRAKQDEWEEQALKRVAQAVSKPRKARKRFVADFLREIQDDAVAASVGPSRVDGIIAALSQPAPDYTALAAVVAAHLAEIEAERVKRRRKRDIEAVLMLAA